MKRCHCLAGQIHWNDKRVYKKFEIRKAAVADLSWALFIRRIRCMGLKYKRNKVQSRVRVCICKKKTTTQMSFESQINKLKSKQSKNCLRLKSMFQIFNSGQQFPSHAQRKLETAFQTDRIFGVRHL